MEGMTTRRLAVRFDENGAMRTVKTSRPINPEKLRIRATYGIKILDCLKRGRTELLGQKSPSALHSEDALGKDYLDTIELEILSTKICDLCYDRYDRQQFKRKIFDIYTNLKRDNNKDLRRRVLTREMSVEELVSADTLELAPDVLKRKREEELEKHYRRNVILPALDEDDDQETLHFSPPASLTPPKALPDKAPQNVTSSESSEDDSDGTEEDDESDAEMDGQDDDASEGPEENHDSKLGELDVHNDHHNDESDQMSSTEDKDELSSKMTADRRIDSEDEGEIKPPDCSAFTIEYIKGKIEARIKGLPKFIAKAFISPFQAGSKRIDLYVKRLVNIHCMHGHLGQ